MLRDWRREIRELTIELNRSEDHYLCFLIIGFSLPEERVFIPLKF